MGSHAQTWRASSAKSRQRATEVCRLARSTAMAAAHALAVNLVRIMPPLAMLACRDAGLLGIAARGSADRASRLMLARSEGSEPVVQFNIRAAGWTACCGRHVRLPRLWFEEVAEEASTVCCAASIGWPGPIGRPCARVPCFRSILPVGCDRLARDGVCCCSIQDEEPGRRFLSSAKEVLACRSCRSPFNAPCRGEPVSSGPYSAQPDRLALRRT
jgi:hypothetical protein